MQVNIHEAKSNLSKLIVKAMQGEEVIISKAGNPLVKVVRIENDKGKNKRVFDHAKSAVSVPHEFFDALPPEVMESFGS